jgi:hypothetical protein
MGGWGFEQFGKALDKVGTAPSPGEHKPQMNARDAQFSRRLENARKAHPV